MKKTILKCLCAMGLVMFGGGEACEVALSQAPDNLVMVANKENASAAGMSLAQARKLLMGEMMTWSDKSKVMVVLPPPGDAGRDVILKKICGMGEGVYLRRMLQAAFVGEPMISLHEAATPAAVKLFVKSNSGAVGFLRKGDVDASVRAVMSLE